MISVSGLVIIDEKGGVVSKQQGYPHSTILLHFPTPKPLQWFGFFPVGTLYGNIDNYIRFEVPTPRLQQIVSKVVPKYKNLEYNFGVRDCVSFAADACRAAGITVPRVNITPGGFVWWLKTFKSGYTHYNVKPYPWSRKTEQYTVKPGDSLWKIAEQSYGRGDQWRKIYEANKQVIGGNPNLIQPGQQLTIPQ
jgi:nucleoid-associated protein YgaU